jgi:hypothetical protein
VTTVRGRHRLVTQLVFRVAVVLLVLFAFTRVVNTDFLRSTIRTDIAVVGHLWDKTTEIWDESKKDRRTP